MTYHILYQFNEKYAPYAGVSITSVLVNNTELESLKIWILGEELSDDSISKFKQVIGEYNREVEFIDTTCLVAKMKELDMPTYRGSYAANMRLFLSEVLPEDVERILYLDADTVVDGELGELFRIDLEGKTLGMVMDSLGELHKEEIGLSKEDGYYNSGVILFDMKKWRANDLSNRIVYHVKNQRKNYPSPDQDLLNVVCRETICTLLPRYNFQPVHLAFNSKAYFRCYARTFYYSLDEIEESKKSPIIFHFFRFIGEFPWNADNVHPDNELFDKYLKSSVWNTYEKKRAEVSGAIKIEKLLYKCIPKTLFLRIFKICHRVFYKKANRLSEENIISKVM